MSDVNFKNFLNWLTHSSWADEPEVDDQSEFQLTVPMEEAKPDWASLPDLPKERIFEFAFGDVRAWPGLGLETEVHDFYMSHFLDGDLWPTHSYYLDSYWFRENGLSTDVTRAVVLYDWAWRLYGDLHQEADFDTSLALVLQMPTTVGRVNVTSVWGMMPAWTDVWNALIRVPRNRTQYLSTWCATASVKSLFILTLKAELLRRIVSGNVVAGAVIGSEGVENTTRYSDRLFNGAELLDDVLTTQWVWFGRAGEALLVCASTAVYTVLGVAASFIAMVDWFAVFNFLVFLGLNYLLFRLLEVFTRPIRRSARKIANWFLRLRGWELKEVEASKPNMERDVKCTNVGPALTINWSEQDVRIEEMAMPGSTLCASAKKPVGAIMVATETTELTLVGCFFRLRDYLVTARHVASQVHNGIADIYLVGPVVNDRGSTLLNLKQAISVEHGLFDVDNNLFKAEGLDVFAVELTKKQWSSLGLTHVSVKKPSCFGQTVTTAGYVNGVLQAGNGLTQRADSCRSELAHTASTLPGFSGSPVFSGSSVVGMHVAGARKSNTLVRIEAVIYFLRKPEYSSDYYDEMYKDLIKNGSDDMSVEYEHDAYVGETKSGRTRYYDEDELVDMGYDPTDKVKRSAFNFNSKTGKNWADYDDDDDDDDYGYIRRRRENAPIPPPATALPKPTITQKSVSFTVEDCRPPVHCNGAPAINDEVVEYIDMKRTELERLGFEPGKYMYPTMTAASEEKSLKLHLDLYSRNCDTVTSQPTSAEKKSCVGIILDLLRANVFEPTPNYKSREHLRSIIQSNLVGAKKSAGRPYQAEGMMTNGNVIERMGVDGLIDMVLLRWNDPIDLKVFSKAEANKLKKIRAEMQRIVAAFPIHSMIKNQALFRGVLETTVENWQESPVKYPFAPGNPGNVEHLERTFRNKRVFEADKTNWDFSMYEYVFEIVREVILGLARQPADMSDEEFAQWRIDAENAINEVYQNVTYVCTNGRAFKQGKPGIMKSGWLLTILVNSIGQLVPHVIAMLRGGSTAAEIASEAFAIIAGGDDTLQTFPEGYDVEAYKERMEALGYPIEMKCNDSFENSEFFSVQFRLTDGVWSYHPVRFTKHLEKLKRVKKENLAAALSCAMINYCWDARFEVFDRMYSHFRKSTPELFPLTLRWSRNALRLKSKGAESAVAADYLDLDEMLDDLIDE